MNGDAESTSQPRESKGLLSAFGVGFSYPWRGFAFLARRPMLLPLAAFPFFLSLLFYVLLFGLGWTYGGDPLTEGMRGSEGLWSRILGYFLVFAFWLVALVVSVFAFAPLAALISSPFNDVLSEKTERIYRGIESDEAFSIRQLLRGLKIGIVGEVRRALTLGALLLFAFFLSFVPIIGPVLGGTASAFFTILYLSLEFTSFSMDRRYYRWEQKSDYLRRYRARTIGFGTMSFFLMAIPLINALFIPILAVAGTMLFCDTEVSEGEPTPGKGLEVKPS